MDRRGKRWRVSPGSGEAYVVAALFVVAAALLRWCLGLYSYELQAFTTFYPAVLFAAILGGSGPGLFAVALGGFIGWWEFLSPFVALLPLSRSDTINLVTYFAASLLIVWATEHYRRLTKRLTDEQALRKLAVDELSHRLKNKVATIQSIVSFRLRDYPEVRDDIASALAALMATDDLITATQGQGAPLRDIIGAEFKPYDLSRVSLAGPKCLLAPKVALTMALLIHELATNAAKYGALSDSAGKLCIGWTLSGKQLDITWQESGGPRISPPDHSGFGTRLFKRALEPFEGKVEADFNPTGLVCKLSLTLPDEPASPGTTEPGPAREAIASD